jgi:hypothetical protein
MKTKWIMKTYGVLFIAEVEGYTLSVNMNAFFPWEILKDGKRVDFAGYHSIPNNLKDSATIQVACERAFKKLLERTTR